MKKVLLYENPQIPPLRQNITLKITNPPGKRGAPRGHKGAKWVLGEPDEFILVSLEIYPKCIHTPGTHTY